MRANRREVTKWLLSASIGSLAAKELSAGTAIHPRESNEALFASVRRRIEKAIADGQATGVSLAVVQAGRIVWEEGFGWANRQAGLRATPHTPFSMASLTKPFTTTTMMTLVAEGRLSLDAAPNRYLPESRLISTNGDADAATVRMLGAHNSGLPGMYESYDANQSSLIPSASDLLKEYGRFAYPPASWYEYSNIGYAALNAISSAMTRTEFGALMRQRVLTPLALHDSFFGSDVSRLGSGATRYDTLGHPIPHCRTSTPASGELYASAHDLALFLLFNLRHHAPGQATILTEQEIGELHRPVFTGPTGVASTFGWFKSHTPSGVPFFFKTGGDPGVANRMCFVPSRDLACVVVTNQSIAQELAYGVCDELMASHLPDWQRPQESCSSPSSSFLAQDAFRGRWHGRLVDGGADAPVELRILPRDDGTFTIGTHRAEKITEMRAEGEAFTGVSKGQIDSPDAIRTGARTLQIKLLPRGDRLIGRLFAVGGDPTLKDVQLPYVLTLERS